jgi:predicted ATPase
LSTSKIKLASVSKIRSKIENFKRNYELFKKDSLDEFENIGVSFDSTIKLEISIDSLESIDEECSKDISNLETCLDEKDPESLINKKKKLEIELGTLKSRLNESEKAYQRYLDELAQWEKRREEINGSAEKINSLEYFKNVLEKSIEITPIELEKAKEDRLQRVKEVYSQLKRLAEVYEDLYKPVQKFIDEHELIKNKYKLNFNVSIAETDFIGKFFNYINQGTRGTFYGAQEGREKLKSILDLYNFNEESNILLFIDEIISSLEMDKRDLKERPVKLTSLLRKNIKKESLYDFLYSLEYLEPKYMLKLAGKELLRLSPGERGVLLLIFYLLVDNDDCPLIIDQPEDNLDNQSVFELVAPCIREARLRRQLFIVTHNPNLAVVCDAEQVIAASIDKANKERVEYISGAIENPLINRKIIDVLEGTKPAFKKRESKYFLFATYV